MAVNLTGIDLSGATIGSPRKTSSPQTGTTTSQDSAPQQSGASITSTASLLAHLEQSLGTQPAIDQNRVAAVSKSLAAGTYPIHPAKIAAGLLLAERSLAPLPLREI